MIANSPIPVSGPTELFTAVDSAAITPSNSLPLAAVKASATDPNGVKLVAVATGTGGNSVTLTTVMPTVEAAAPAVAVVSNDVTVTLAAVGTRGTLEVQGMRFESVAKGTAGNSPTLAFVNPGTASASASVGVSTNAITLNLATDAGSKSTLTNQGIVYTAVDGGAGGDDITIALVNPGTPSAPLGVTVVGDAISVNLATDAGTAQVETATGAGTVSGSGNASIVVTGVGITGSPLTIPVAVLDTDTPAIWVEKVRVVLAATAAITALYAVGGTGTAITLTEIVPNGNDGTLNIAIATGTATGITTAASSANTTAGVAPAITSTRQQVALAVANNTDANDLVTVVDPGTSTLVTAVSATHLATGGGSPAPTTTRQQALTLLRASSPAMALLSVFVSDENTHRVLAARSTTALAGGTLRSISGVGDVVTALNADEDFQALAVASCESLSLEQRVALAQDVTTLSGGIAGAWTLDSNFTRAISVAVDGNVAYVPFNSSDPVVVAMKAGSFYPIAAKQVKSTNTTATGIVGHI